MNLELSVVIPAYNEANSIRRNLQIIKDYFDSLNIGYELIVVNDGSTDATLDEIREFSKSADNLRILNNPGNKGKGYTVRRGVLESRGKYILFTDADLSTPIEEFGKLMNYIKEDVDITFGSRAMAQSDLKVRQPWYRVLLGRLANKAIQTIVPALKGINDTQCGFKLFKGDVARKIFPLQRIERWGFDFEILHIARKYGYRVVEVPVQWSHSGDSRIRLLDYPKTFLELLKVRNNDRKGLYSAELNENNR